MFNNENNVSELLRGKNKKRNIMHLTLSAKYKVKTGILCILLSQQSIKSKLEDHYLNFSANYKMKTGILCILLFYSLCKIQLHDMCKIQSTERNSMYCVLEFLRNVELGLILDLSWPPIELTEKICKPEEKLILGNASRHCRRGGHWIIGQV